MRSREELARILHEEVLDIWQVSDLTGVGRNSIHTYLVRPSSDFPRPVWESAPTDGSGSQKRHPTRLWARVEIENWLANRPIKTKSTPTQRARTAGKNP